MQEGSFIPLHRALPTALGSGQCPGAPSRAPQAWPCLVHPTHLSPPLPPNPTPFALLQRPTQHHPSPPALGGWSHRPCRQWPSISRVQGRDCICLSETSPRHGPARRLAHRRCLMNAPSDLPTVLPHVENPASSRALARPALYIVGLPSPLPLPAPALGSRKEPGVHMPQTPRGTLGPYFCRG